MIRLESALLLLIGLIGAQGEEAPVPGQGIFAGLQPQPTFKEVDYLGHQAERQRYADASDFVYNFPAQEGEATIGRGGESWQVDIDNKPSMWRSDAMSQTMFMLAPCGLNVPHLHSRASKVLHVLEGQVSVGFVEEGSVSTSRAISYNLTVGQSIVIPTGLPMWVHNINCQRARYLDTWANSDPGILSLVPAILKMPLETIAAAFNIDTSTANMLISRMRSPIELGPQECLTRCNVSAAPSNSPSSSPSQAKSQELLSEPSTTIHTLVSG